MSEVSQEQHGLNIAVVGATGVVGETMLDILAERKFPAETVHALASERSVGRLVDYGQRSLAVDDLAGFDFSQTDIALFSAGGSIAREYGPRAAEAGCIVIDNSSCFRYQDDIPLVVPEINADLLDQITPGRGAIIANPNCSTIQMVVALQGIQNLVGISRINVATYQSVSGAGHSQLESLATQTASRLSFKPLDEVQPEEVMAFNVQPHIDALQENGYTREEMKMLWETRKIFADQQINVNATCVRVPVFFGHAMALHIETRSPIDLQQAAREIDQTEGVSFIQAENEWPTPVTHSAGKDEVFVSRLRKDLSHPNGLNLWVVADNIRKGAALNAVQIAEQLLLRGKCIAGPAASVDAAA